MINRHDDSLMRRASEKLTYIIHDSFSSFNNIDLFHSILADCCMLKSREWGPIVQKQNSDSFSDS